MRVLVIDDYVQTEMAVAAALGGTGHEVTGASDPDDLPEVLGSRGPFDLALVDMYFGPQSRSGIGALRILRDQSPATATVVNSAKEEQNRLLFLLAAFRFFDPLTAVSKSISGPAIRELADTAARGEVPFPEGAREYRPGGPLGDPLSQLLRSASDLTLWRELARFHKRGEIARAAIVAESTVDKFTSAMYPVVEDLEARLRGSVPVSGYSGYGEGQAGTHNAPLIRLTRFAGEHQAFFRDQDVADLLAETWGTPQRTPSPGSAAVRADRRGRSPRRRGGPG
jgi:CheY-like chemotaxis protein